MVGKYERAGQHLLSAASTQIKDVVLSLIPMTIYSFVTPVGRVAMQ